MATIRSFFRVILCKNIQQNKLRLPLKFARLYNTQLGDTAKLFTPDGRVWKMKVVKDRPNIQFVQGFRDFALHYSLKYGHLLRFKYTCMSNFRVQIFDQSCCEIPFQSRANAPPNSSTNKTKTPQKRHNLSNFRSESGFVSPRHFKSRRPCFQVQLKSYSRSHGVRIPVGFSREHMAGARAGDVELEVGDGRHWTVALTRRENGYLRLGKGLKVFSRENKLTKGDVCIFELIKGTPYVFKVSIPVAV